ncbi:hypothetical protein SSX86_014410 [Deinandra increscens subsp. villosa]|uniref:Uncharacterized protein n=1 Tax=Deinandra increscens subsp. villosa TaxID=3103831 RepID=A0AAP0D3H9_9ASTR
MALSSMSSLICCGSSIISKRPSLNYFSYNIHPKPSQLSLASVLISKNKDNLLASYNINRSRSLLQYDPMMKMTIQARPRRFVIRSNITPPPSGVPLPPAGSPSGSWRNWIVGIVLTIVLPFCTNKWGPLLVLKNKVDNVVNTAEYMAETLEAVAEKVDKVIDSITDDLPQTSQLRKTLEAIDAVAEGVAKTAHIADTIIDQGQI